MPRQHLALIFAAREKGMLARCASPCPLTGSALIRYATLAAAVASFARPGGVARRRGGATRARAT